MRLSRLKASPAARTGFSSQQAPQAKDPAQPANLWEPADGPTGEDFGAHGAFDAKATERSPQLWASQHHGLLSGLTVGGLAAGLAAWKRNRRA